MLTELRNADGALPEQYTGRMCGRYATALNEAEWSGIFPVSPDTVTFPEPRYNLAPTQGAPIIRELAGEWRLDVLRWGLIPAWAKSPADVRYNLFNARAEGVADKPSFRAAFRSRRCVMPASGFYEWRSGENGKQPYYISRTDGKPMLFAGLWERWERGDEQLESCTMITTEANEFMQQLHTRMPVILESEDRLVWLEEGPEELLKPSPEGVLQAWPVSRAVGNVRNEGPELIRALT